MTRDRWTVMVDTLAGRPPRPPRGKTGRVHRVPWLTTDDPDEREAELSQHAARQAPSSDGYAARRPWDAPARRWTR